VRFWCTFFLFLFALNVSLAAVDEDIERLEQSIHASEEKLHKMKAIQQQKATQIDVNHIQNTWLEKDYTRYPPNHYYNLFKLTPANELYDIEFHFWGQVDQNIFPDAYGLFINNGEADFAVLGQNTVQRYWLNIVRPTIEGQVLQFFNYFLNAGFGRNQIALYDAFVDINYYRLLGLQVGQQMSLVSGIENFINNFDYVSRAFTMQVSNAAMLAPDRQLGVVAHGSFGASGDEPYFRGLSLLGFDDMFSYQFGWLVDTPDNSVPAGSFDFLNSINLNQENDLNNMAFEARLFINPFIDKPATLLQHLGIGIAASLGHPSQQTGLPSLISVGQNPIYRYANFVIKNNETTNFTFNNVLANGVRNRIHPQMVWGYGAFGLLADWTQTTQQLVFSQNTQGGTPFIPPYDGPEKSVTQTNSANQISLIYNLTQEEFNLFHFIPNMPFHPFEKNAYGGWQLVFRLSGLNLDPSVFNDSSPYTLNNQQYTYYYFVDPRLSVQKANTWSIGFNWYWNQFLRISSEYDQTNFVGGCSTGAIDPISGQISGCLTNASTQAIVDSFSGLNSSTFLSSSQVLNRPVERIFMTRIQVQF